MEFNIEFLQFSSLVTSIYRLQVQMSIWLEIPRRCPNIKQEVSGQTTVRSAFQILQKFFPELSRIRTVLPYHLDCGTLAACNFHIKTWLVRTMKTVTQTTII
jgi:hypothetical protein